jgi:hypothetical protein
MTKMPSFSTVIQYSIRSLSQSNKVRKRKETEDIKKWMEPIKLSLFVGDTILYIEKPLRFPPKSLKTNKWIQ